MVMSGKKIAIAAASLLLAAAILMVGTYAWTQTINKVNEFMGSKEGVILHDDFDLGTGTKDVYVENPSEAAVFVRIRLDEVMNLTSNTWRPSSPKVQSEWETHTYGESAADCGNTSAAGDKFHDYFEWTMGGQKYYMPGVDSTQVVQDTTVYNGTEPGVKQTPAMSAAGGGIITAGYYLNTLTAPERDEFVGWIYDTDGYVYWSQPLYKGEVTGLLLHQVNKLSHLSEKDYYYAIDVIVEAVDLSDIPMWTQGLGSVDGSGATYDAATPEGVQVINNIVSLASWYRGLTGTSADVGKIFVADNYSWTVIKADGGSILVVSTSTVGISAFGASNDYDASSLKATLTTFYNGLNELKLAAQPVDLTDAGGMSGVAASGSSDAFALSQQEAQTLFASDAARKANAAYWLRTPGAHGLACFVDANGSVLDNCAVNQSNGIRAALWLAVPSAG